MQRYVIYFFGTDYNRVKIGYSIENLYRRKRDIQTGCPDPIKLLGIIPCNNKVEMMDCERDLHRQFQKYNTVGEWFRLTPEISDYIKNFTELGKEILEEDRLRELQNNWRHKNLDYNRERQRRYQYNRYNSDSEFRNRERQRRRNRYKNDPEYRQRKLESNSLRKPRKRRIISDQTLTLPGIE